MRVAKLRKDATALKAEHDEQIAMVGDGMEDAEACRKTYKHEVALCCDTYKKLGAVEVKNESGTEKTVPTSIEKGYKQQVKLIRRILDKIDEVKASFKNVKADIKERVKKLKIRVNPFMLNDTMHYKIEMKKGLCWRTIHKTKYYDEVLRQIKNLSEIKNVLWIK